MRRILTSVFWVLTLSESVIAADVVPAVDRRFASKTAETPSFQRHVLPLLGRLGCNGRACHGSFQGQGGFRLSLFGYDFEADHKALTGGDKPRVDREQPEDSLMLLKPTQELPHKGGKRVTVGTWQHRIIQRWIEAGAAPAKDDDAEFMTLEVEPKEIVFQKLGESKPLKVIAHWSDGTQEDVTPLCRFRSNDEATASINESGIVTATGKGDTDVVAFYDNGVAPVQVLLPVSDRIGPKYPSVPTPTKIDELVVAKLRKLGVVPSDLCTDEEFLRRVSLDMTGTLPTPREVTDFVADKSSDKRRKKVDELLERPAYAAFWTTRLCDLTGNTESTGPLGGEQALNREKATQWYLWIHRRVKDNVPYDKLVEGIVLAVSRRPDQSFEDYSAEMSAYFRKDNPVDFAERDNLPYFWSRRTVGKPEDKALSFAHAFLGVSLQCAQCHKHPYDQWTKQDFDQFTAFFNGIRFGDSTRDRETSKKMSAAHELVGDPDSGTYKRKFQSLLEEGKVVPFKEVAVPVQKKVAARAKSAKSNPKLGRVITPKLLGGEEVIAGEYPDPRQPLMDWVRQEDNPYFARAFVNRVWSVYFNVGLIDPPDDQNLANPPSNPALLDYLTAAFIKSGYDMRWLHREIANSRTYQLSWRANETNQLDERNYSRAVIRRLPAEVAADAVELATASAEERRQLDEDPINTRAIGIVNGHVGAKANNYAATLFGKPPRQINCDCERSNEPSLLQTVYLRNDEEVLKRLANKHGWLNELYREKNLDRDALIREAYLRTLGRPPTEPQFELARAYFKESKDNVSGLRDLLWALLNSKEFIVNH